MPCIFPCPIYNGQMLIMNKSVNENPKDTKNDSGIIIKDMPTSILYLKTNKLVTALYMVTDIIDKDEPLRNKLRTLGIEIILDVHSATIDACSKISAIMSFLDIASAISIISEMNSSILRKEFLKLYQSIADSTDKTVISNRPINLSEFFATSPPDVFPLPGGKKTSIGHKHPTRIGVQKGGTLMKALSDRINPEVKSNTLGLASRVRDFNIVKKQRRDDIINIIKTYEGNATIKDIREKINNENSEPPIFSEKTLQRELMSMIKDDVLSRTGTKRWSRYLLKSKS